MSVQFILGRAGTGKTEHILTELVRESQQRPLGPPLYWLVPNQATFISQRRLMLNTNVSATARIRVLGPAQLCHALLGQMGIGVPQIISPIARLLVLGKAVTGVKNELKYFAPSLHKSGFLPALDATLQQLVRENQNAQSLRAVAEGLDGNSSNRAVCAKLRDMALIMEAWNKHLSQQRFDPDNLPNYLCTLLTGQGQIFCDTQIFVDAFSSMSGTEINLLCRLAKCVKSVVITLLVDPARGSAAGAPFDEVAPAFRRTHRLYQRLMAQLAKDNVAVAPNICLDEPLRFANSELRRMEEMLACAPVSPAARVSPVSPASPASPVSPQVPRGDEIAVTVVPDITTEVVRIAREIRRLIRQGFRYREIGIITNAIEAYEEPIRRYFSSYQIPVFIDHQKPVTIHPMTSGARALLRLGEDGYRLADLLIFLRSGMTPIAATDVDEFENFALAHAMDFRSLKEPWTLDASPRRPRASGASMESGYSSQLAAANRVRAGLNDILGNWVETCGGRKMGVAEWTEKFQAILLSPQAWAKLEAEIQAATARGDAQTAALHRAMGTQLSELFDVIRLEMPDDPAAFSEFAHIISTCFDGLMLRLIPPTVDQVLVTSAQRSRHPEFKIVFIPGFVDKKFPLVTDENLVLNHADIEKMSIRMPEVFSTLTQNVLSAPFFDYVAMTRASDRMFISRPRVDSAGDHVAASIYEAELRALAPGERKPEPAPESAWIDDLTSPHDALIFAGRQYAATDQSAPGALAMLEWLDSDAPAPLRQSWRALRSRLGGRLIADVDSGRLLADPNGVAEVSISALEVYARCPLKYYFRHLIALRPRDQWRADAMEIGSLNHTVLENVFAKIIAGEGPLAGWPAANAAAIRKAVDDAVAEACVGLNLHAANAAPELLPMIDLLQANLRHVLEYQAHLCTALNLKPAEVEYRLTRHLDEVSVPVSADTTALNADALTVRLVGKIDRIDNTPDNQAIVFDYKSGDEKLKEAHIAAGLQLQLIGYMFALDDQARGTAIPRVSIGAFYQPLTPSFRDNSLDQGADAAEPSEIYSNVGARGIINADALPTENVAEVAQWIKLERNKDGRWSKRCDGRSTAAFDNVKLIGREKIISLAQQILDGNIRPAPIRLTTSTTACDQCEFKACCPFDRITGVYRGMTSSGAGVDRAEGAPA